MALHFKGVGCHERPFYPAFTLAKAAHTIPKLLWNPPQERRRIDRFSSIRQHFRMRDNLLAVEGWRQYYKNTRDRGRQFAVHARALRGESLGGLVPRRTAEATLT